MKIGYLYDKEEKEIKKDIEKGLEVTVGVDVSSLLDTINIHEINNPESPSSVLSLVKKECMLILGKIELEGGKNEERKEDISKA